MVEINVLCVHTTHVARQAQLSLILIDQQPVDQAIQHMRQAEAICHGMVCHIHEHMWADSARLCFFYAYERLLKAGRYSIQLLILQFSENSLESTQNLFEIAEYFRSSNRIFIRFFSKFSKIFYLRKHYPTFH